MDHSISADKSFTPFGEAPCLGTYQKQPRLNSATKRKSRDKSVQDHFMSTIASLA
jgi:hypothetical protein